jgi:hypothetical protein
MPLYAFKREIKGKLQFWFAKIVRSSKMLILHLFSTSAKPGAYMVDV